MELEVLGIEQRTAEAVLAGLHLLEVPGSQDVALDVQFRPDQVPGHSAEVLAV